MRFVFTIPAAFLVAASSASACPAGAFMNVANAEGAGPGYPRPRVLARCEANALVIQGNGIPHYRFVAMTPNPLIEQTYDFRLPLDPARTAQSTPIPSLGPAGIAINGTVFYGPNEAAQPAHQAWGDPIHNRIVDRCLGHTAREYHYHGLASECLAPAAKAGAPSPILGFAFDGFPIYGPWGCLDRACRRVVKFKSGYVRIGNPTRDAWSAYRYEARNDAATLDACNGRVGPDGTYRYHATETFPYIVGCYAGTPIARPRPQGPPPGPPRPR